MRTNNFEIKLSKKAQDFFNKMPDEFAKAVEKGLKNVTNIIYRDLKNKAPGNLKLKKEISNRNIDLKLGVKSEGTGSLKGIITTDDWKWVFIEYGAKPHTIKIDNAKLLSDLSVVFGKKIEHPGLAKRPFVRPTVDENKDKAKKKIMSQINKAWKNLK